MNASMMVWTAANVLSMLAAYWIHGRNVVLAKQNEDLARAMMRGWEEMEARIEAQRVAIEAAVLASVPA